MSFLDPFGEGVSVVSGGLSRPSHKRHRSRSRSHHHKRRHSSRSRSHSRSRGGGGGIGASLGAGLSSVFFDNDDDDRYRRNNASRGSFFGLGAGGNHSRSSFFGTSKSSYYKRSSRHGFLHRSYKQLKKLLRNLSRWARRHPWKVFFMVIMPLISGGALTALLARFGLRLPRSLENLVGLASKAATGNSGGAFSDAVRMAGDFGVGGHSSSATYSHHTSQPSLGAFWDGGDRRGGGDGGWGDAAAGMAKMFI